MYAIRSYYDGEGSGPAVLIRAIVRGSEYYQDTVVASSAPGPFGVGPGDGTSADIRCSSTTIIGKPGNVIGVGEWVSSLAFGAAVSAGGDDRRLRIADGEGSGPAVLLRAIVRGSEYYQDTVVASSALV